MKKIIFISIILSLLYTSCKSEKKKEKTEEIVTTETKKGTESSKVNSRVTHIVDVADSNLFWTGYKPTGNHKGTLKINNGSITMEKGVLKDCSFEIDMQSIVNTDLKDPDDNKKIVKHLKSADFFDSKTFPKASFKSTSISSDKTGSVNIKGQITIKGITKTILISAIIKEKGEIVRLKALPFKINRTYFGVKYKSKSFLPDLKDKFINDEFDISFAIKTHKI